MTLFTNAHPITCLSRTLTRNDEQGAKRGLRRGPSAEPLGKKPQKYGNLTHLTPNGANKPHMRVRVRVRVGGQVLGPLGR